MSDNPLKDYKDAFRANLPSGMTYDSDIARYFVNDHRFTAPWTAEDYLNYLIKFGFETLSVYSVAGFEPSLVFDFGGEFYRTGGTTSTFTDAITHSRSGNATMVDSDGLLKWAPHNLLSYSEDFTQWSVGADLSVEASAIPAPNNEMTAWKVTKTGASNLAIITGGVINNPSQTKKIWARTVSGTGTIALMGYYGFSKYRVTLTEEWQLFEAPADYSETGGPNFYAVDFRFGNLTEVLIWGAHLYRSDLGGMVDNPDRGDSYVPTTSSAVYLPRRGHHVYNGSAWVNEGVLHESEARTNLITYSDLSANINPAGATLTANIASGIDGETSAATLIEDTSTGVHRFTQSVSPTITSGAPYSASIYAKANGRTEIRLAENATTGAYATFNLLDGSIVSSGFGGSGVAEDMGNGWYRCTMTFTSAGTVGRIDVSLLSSGSISYTGDGASGVYLYGAQLEAASTPSSYIPTFGSTVTRAAETLTIPSANLPWPSPVVIGPELVTNGTFDTDVTGTTPATWETNNANASLIKQSDGTALFTSTSFAYARIQDASRPVLPAGVYQVSFEISEWVAGLVNVHVGLGVGGNVVSGNGSYSYLFTSTVEQAYEFQIRPNSGGTGSFKIDNISVREIDPLAVSIQMQGQMTYVDDGDNATATFVRWQAISGQYIQKRLRTDSTRTGASYALMNNGVATIGQDTNGAVADLSAGINVPFNTASRFGSTFLNVALNGVAASALSTPTALPDLSSTDLELGYRYMGTIKQFRIWANDLEDAGVAEAST